MRLILFTVVAATVAGFLAGGTLRGFPSVKVRGAWLALAGVFMQFIPSGGTLGTWLLYASFVALIAFAVLNVRTHGFALILIGLALNAIVIVANQGMPVTRDALAGSNQSETLNDLIANGGAKHHLADAGTILLRLGDVIALGTPLDQAISVGDVCVQLGAAWFIVFSMPRRHPRVVTTKATT
jgi:Family of unknown function (DUF5317)